MMMEPRGISGQTLIRVVGGVHLYGTAGPDDVQDGQVIRIATAEEILLNQVILGYDMGDPAGGAGHYEVFEVQRWLKHLGDGEINSYDVLYAPEEQVVELDAELWAEVLPVAYAQVSRKLGGFVGYVRRFVLNAQRVPDPTTATSELSHVVRVAHELVELRETGHLTFPRPERAHLLEIEGGAVGYDAVVAETAALLARADAAAENPALPAEPDRAALDGYLLTLRRRIIAQ